MSHLEHHASSPASARCAVLTVSDSRTAATDTSGRAIVELLETHGHTVADRRLVRDDASAVRDAIDRWLGQDDIHIVLTTGGTGITSRDGTYEVVSALLEKRIDGFGELFRMLSFQDIGAAAMMSRACAGTARGRVVIAMPGSEHAVRLAMTRLVIPEIGHLLREVQAVGAHRAPFHTSSTSMRPFTRTISFDEALRLLREAAVPIPRTEPASLDEAHGRVLAAGVHAPGDVPPFDRAAMDGYTVVAETTAAATRERPVSLRRAGVVYTGDAPLGRIGSGECMEIATGAPLPDGADAVVPVEDTAWDADGTHISVRAGVAPGQNVGPRASDIAAGAVALAPGTHLTPARVGVLAAIGVTRVEVFARPTVVIASTGNEIVAPGQPLGPGQIYDVNRYTLPPLVDAHGGRAIVSGTVGDTLEALDRALTEARTADLVVLSGGSSVGERNLLVDAARRHGEVIFHGIAVKPGKPTLLARTGERQLLLGMPGNPTSCLSNGYLLLVPLLRRLAHLPAWRPQVVAVTLAQDVRSTSDRHQFYPVRLDAAGAVPVFKRSGDVTSLSPADGYIEVPVGVDHVAAGSRVAVTLF